MKSKHKRRAALAPRAPQAAQAPPSLPLMDVAAYPAHDSLMYPLAHALVLRRDHGSMTEAAFVSWLVHRLPVTAVDTLGNIHVDLRSAPDHRTLFTAHTDTVHDGGGANAVRVDARYWRADGAALGADDGAGIALLYHMIQNSVPGYYIFFRGEERGGVGSSGLYELHPELFTEFDRAVAFDRAGYHDVITHQSGRRCASDAFADALAAALTTDDFTLAFAPSDGGVYTDTAEFMDTVPECTNVSVGYFNQHGSHEHQDIEFLQKLAQQLLCVEWDELPVKRDPNVWGGRAAVPGGINLTWAGLAPYADYDTPTAGGSSLERRVCAAMGSYDEPALADAFHTHGSTAVNVVLCHYDLTPYDHGLKLPAAHQAATDAWLRGDDAWLSKQCLRSAQVLAESLVYYCDWTAADATRGLK